MTQLFWIFLRIGLLSFGGPAAQIALMQTELVDRHKLISQDKFLKALSFCMLLPGPEAMQLATFIGWHRAGPRGGVLAGSLFILPGACLIATLAVIYSAYGSVPLVQGAFLGIQAVVVLVVIEALSRLARRSFTSWGQIIVAIAAFVSLFLFALPFPLIILAALIIGALFFAPRPGQTPTSGSVAPRSVLVTAALWLVPLGAIMISSMGFLADLAWFYSKLAVVSFGGAYAVLSYLSQGAVGTFAWITTDQMIDALGLAETTPGPLILVTQFVAMIAGHAEGGVGTALIAGIIALWMTFLPCFLWIFACAPSLERLLAMPRLAGALSGVSAAVVGLIASLSLWFAIHVFFTQTQRLEGPVVTLELPVLSSLSPISCMIAGILAVPLFRGAWPLPYVLGCAAILGTTARAVMG